MKHYVLGSKASREEYATEAAGKPALERIISHPVAKAVRIGVTESVGREMATGRIKTKIQKDLAAEKEPSGIFDKVAARVGGLENVKVPVTV